MTKPGILIRTSSQYARLAFAALCFAAAPVGSVPVLNADLIDFLTVSGNNLGGNAAFSQFTNSPVPTAGV
jgi:hypothetical protein